MKALIILAAFAFSTVSFASVIKTDSGFVTWTVKINKKNEGVLRYSRSSVQINGSNANTPAEMREAMNISFNSGVGGLSETPMTFAHNDERSQESVEAKIKEFIAKDISKFNVTGEEPELTMSGVECTESGFLKKKLECQAQFKHKQVLNLK